MKRKCLSISSFLALLVCLTAVGAVVQTQAQTRDKYVVSAEAGGINFVSGNVTVVRKGTRTNVAVTDQDNLENGDVLTTGMGGRVEVLLSPGSYMRVAENSEFEMTDTSLDHLRIKLLKGSVIIEVVGTDDTTLSLEVLTPQTNAVIVKRGIYRFNVLPSGATEVLVRKGRAIVGPYAEEVKGGKMITISSGGMSVLAKIDKRAPDSLEFWSRERAEYLASINRSLAPTTTIYISTDIYSNNTYYNRNRGAWVYDSRRGCYVFIPGRGGSSSPYGYDYRGRCCVNGRGNETPSNVPPSNPPGGGGGGVGNPSGGGGGGDGTPAPDAPTGRGRPRDPDSGSRNRPLDPVDGGGERPERPITRPDSPAPVSRPENTAPVSRPDPPSAPSAPSSPPPSAPAESSPPPSSPPPSSPPPSEAPSRSEAPAQRESPNR